MIHFNFIVDEIDADNILHSLMNEANKCRSDALMCRMDGNADGKVTWLESRADYLDELRNKMKYTRMDFDDKDVLHSEIKALTKEIDDMVWSTAISPERKEIIVPALWRRHDLLSELLRKLMEKSDA